MTYFKKTYTTQVNLSQATVNNEGILLASIVKPVIDGMCVEIQNGTFDYSQYAFGRMVGSNLRGKSGLYAIVNKRFKKIYLGGSHKLDQRKGEYNNNLSKPQRLRKVYASMREDLQNGNVNDFHYVPVLVISRELFININETTITQFFDEHVENLLLTEYLNENHPFKPMFYNVTTIGRFQPGNTFGGHPSSGQKDKPVAYGEVIAFGSVSCAAAALGVDRKVIRIRRERGQLTEIPLTTGPDGGLSFENFPGIKIKTVGDAEQAKQQHAATIAQVKNALRFRASNS